MISAVFHVFVLYKPDEANVFKNDQFEENGFVFDSVEFVCVRQNVAMIKTDQYVGLNRRVCAVL